MSDARQCESGTASETVPSGVDPGPAGAATGDLPTIREALILRVSPDDVIVLTISEHEPWEPAMVERVKASWSASTGLANRVVVAQGIDVTVMRPDTPVTAADVAREQAWALRTVTAR